MSRERGVALAIALLLVTLLTLLAITGMRTSVAEWWMVGSEQFHRRASEAASAGVETAVVRLVASAGVVGDDTRMDGTIAGAAYTLNIRRAGAEAALPAMSVEKFVGKHFEIVSTGTSSRGALDVQVQGVLVISPVNGVRDFQRVGDGLDPAAPP